MQNELRALPVAIARSGALVTTVPIGELPGFRILHHVGKGGLGDVYVAERISTGGKVAIKILRDELGSGDVERRIRREVDCCLMVCEGNGRLRLSFPIDTAGAFNSTPPLLETNSPGAGDWRQVAGRLSPGESLVLVSDAVAEWLLMDPSRRLPWLLGSDEAAWTEALGAAREWHDMVNDDVTVVAVRCKERVSAR